MAKAGSVEGVTQAVAVPTAAGCLAMVVVAVTARDSPASLEVVAWAPDWAVAGLGAVATEEAVEVAGVWGEARAVAATEEATAEVEAARLEVGVAVLAAAAALAAVGCRARCRQRRVGCDPCLHHRVRHMSR